jgi:DNA (cytosine-5)-methyltransferase 1
MGPGSRGAGSRPADGGESVRFLSVCSGIEAASVAWRPLGWHAAAFAEIEKFPAAVLRHHYPDVENRGDMTRFPEWPDAAIDVLVGGTPCQSFSVAGLRKGLADPRGNLALTYLAVLDRYRPRWMVWENVPGALSVDDGRALGAFLGGLSELGYGWAYRSLDAQYFRLAQRRRRVFVVGHLGDWRRAAAVLFERASLSGHPAPRREEGEKPAPCLGAGPVSGGRKYGTDADSADSLIPSTGDISHCLNAGGMGRIDYESETLIAHALRADGFDASEDGTGRGTPLVAETLRQHPRPGSNSVGQIVATCYDDPRRFDARGIHGGGDHGDLHPPLSTVNCQQFVGLSAHQPAIAFAGQAGGDRTSSGALAEELSPTLHKSQIMDVMHRMQVRRLTPRECERLQGFPDDYTLIPYNGKPAKDGPRYKALGNSMAVPCMSWIGRRIQMVDDLG